MSSSENYGVGDLPQLDDLSSLGLTERELFTIFMKYSEGDVDSLPAEDDTSKQSTSSRDDRPSTSDGGSLLQRKMAQGADSSPNSQHELEYDSSQMTCSTTHTTPLKHLMMRNHARQQTQYTEFVAACSDCDLPEVTKSYFKSLASQIVQIGGLLQHFAAREDKEEAEEAILDGTEVLTRLLESSGNNCSDQLANIKWLQELALFQIVPTDVALWSIYRQRVQLVSKFVLIVLHRALFDRSNHAADISPFPPSPNTTSSKALSSSTTLTSSIP